MAHSVNTAVKQLSEPKNIAKATWCRVLSFSTVHICDQWCNHLFAVFWECATPPHIHPTSRYIIACDQFYLAFTHISIASDKCWGGKAWVQGKGKWENISEKGLVSNSTLAWIYGCIPASVLMRERMPRWPTKFVIGRKYFVMMS